MKATLSIIIPTYKRAEILGRCLEYLEKQTIASELEVIVVSDGHDEATAQMFTNPKWKIDVQFYEIKKAQQGVARNRGLQAATAPYVLFIGDDAWLEPAACELHLAAHQNSATKHAVLGFTTWDPALEITPVMQWLEKSGWQFGYPMIAKYAHDYIPQMELQARFTYTIHISLPAAAAKAHTFREDVTQYGWEDIEWGQRLRDAGIKLWYEPDAVAYHHHHVTLEQSLTRMRTLGESVKSYPTTGRQPTGIKLLAYRLAALMPTMTGKHRKAFLKGLR